ncbi:FAD-binding oxidoreductase [Saccharopolyspora shandongensis]|uniref:FAD-binding oxidoreductase n=1 Tax=Saccharopolyspora shandongensis TaxID=418495 RepID=UPI003437B2D1
MGTEMLRGIRGTVVWRGSDAYERTRRAMLWNAWKPERFPELIVTVASRDDVVRAVRFARARGLRVAVRGGGHNWWGSPLRDGGMLVDLSGLRDVVINPAARTARLSPVVSNRRLAAALAEHGLAFPAGHCGQVVVSGYLLAGGFGWNTRVWGPACHSVREIDVVTADGELVYANERDNAELFWAARGAGPGFFGVVTSYLVDVYPLPRALTTSTYVYSLADAEEVAGWASDLGDRLPPMVEPSFLLAAAPPGVTAEQPGKVAIVTAAAFADSTDAAVEALAPLDRCPAAGRALQAQVAVPSTFDGLFDAAATFWPEGRRYAADTAWSNAELGDVVSRLREPILAAPARESVILATLSPELRDVDPAADTAFSVAGRTLLDCYAVWQERADDAANRAWLRETMAALEPVTVGHYVGEADLTAEPERARRCYTEQNWQRLQALRARFDPDGLFHTYPDGVAPR